ncbi:hypothetical protein PCIT_a0605 [Pseudoalteromonas citrea]|uniref:Uncharacterized protein n=1 Tax=Pseudoalteromonas citrea TaxID=43655 RepID=A0AAD4AL22_9GAMM|nr:hypothetical protein PCIT_a0605 [Pseudoalteromonas citrea]
MWGVLIFWRRGVMVSLVATFVEKAQLVFIVIICSNQNYQT